MAGGLKSFEVELYNLYKESKKFPHITLPQCPKVQAPRLFHLVCAFEHKLCESKRR